METNIERPLRHRSDGEDFLSENGIERFNRPRYGGNTALRVNGGAATEPIPPGPPKPPSFLPIDPPSAGA